MVTVSNRLLKGNLAKSQIFLVTTSNLSGSKKIHRFSEEVEWQKYGQVTRPHLPAHAGWLVVRFLYIHDDVIKLLFCSLLWFSGDRKPTNLREDITVLDGAEKNLNVNPIVDERRRAIE